MATTIKFKRSSVPGKKPTTSDLAAGEIGLNIRDGKMFGANSSAVFEIGANIQAIHVGSITVGNGATTYTLPTARGSNKDFLSTDGSGTLTFRAVNFTSNAYAAANSYVNDRESAIFANVNPRFISVVGTAATANTKSVQALADAAAANTRAEGARTLAVSVNTSLNAYKANTNPRFDLYLPLTGGTLSANLKISSASNDAMLTIESTNPGTVAAPVIDLYKNSASPADGDYLGQLKFQGESDSGAKRVYAKFTGKASDVSNGSEDGLFEIAVRSGGSNKITNRLTGSETQTLNGTVFTENGERLASNTYVNAREDAIFANVNPRIISVVGTAATANTKAVQALADASAANTRAGNILTAVQGVNTALEAYKANTNPRFDGKIDKSGGLFTGDVTFANAAAVHSLTVNTTLLFSNVNMGSGSTHPPHQEGLLFYDNIHKTLNYYSDDANVIHELGLEEHQRVYNNTGSTIGKGKPLYFSGNYTAGNVDVPTVGLADATDVNAYNAQGLAASDIPNNSYGYCIIAGQLHDVDTSALSAGQNFFVGLTPGAVQNQSPTYPNFPMCLGWVVNSDASEGILLVNQQNHSVNSFRVRTSAHIGTDLRVDGDLTVVGTTTTTTTADQTTGTTMFRLNEGSAIGEAGTTFTGTGLDDAFFSGHFTGTTATTYYVRICTAGAGLGTGGVDTFDVALNSGFNPMLSTNNDITGSAQLIHSADNISVEFGATTGHTANDQWSGTASPVNVDTGFWTNRNTGTSGVGYTHMGLYFDVSDSKWKLVQGYRPTPSGTIDQSNNSHSFATLVANTFQGKLVGNVTGTVTGTATSADSLSSSRNIQLTGDVTGVSPFNGTNNAVITTVVASSVTAPYLEVANATALYTTKAYAAANTYVNAREDAIFANVNPRIISVVGTAATANTKAVQALADAAAANTRAEGARTLAVNANTNLNAYKANTNPRFDLYLEVANATPSVDTTLTGNTSIQRLDIEDNAGTSVFSTALRNGVFFGNNYFISSYDFEVNTTSTSTTTIAASRGEEVAVEFLVLVTDTASTPPARQFSKILAIHDGNNAFISEYGQMYTGSGPLASFSATFQRTPDYIYLEANPTTSNRLKYKVTRMGMRD